MLRNHFQTVTILCRLWHAVERRRRGMRAWLLTLLSLATVATTTHADNHIINGVKIFERGQYHAVSAGLSPRIGSMGPLHTVHSVQLIANTASIPAQHRVRFGLRYVVEGHPRGAAVEVRMLTRFPNGGLLEPSTGQRHTVHEYRMPVLLGVPGYRDFSLDEVWEVVPGRWQFEFWYGDRKLKEQEFCLFDPAGPLPVTCPQTVSSTQVRR